MAAESSASLARLCQGTSLTRAPAYLWSSRGGAAAGQAARPPPTTTTWSTCRRARAHAASAGLRSRPCRRPCCACPPAATFRKLLAARGLKQGARRAGAGPAPGHARRPAGAAGRAARAAAPGPRRGAERLWWRSRRRARWRGGGHAFRHQPGGGPVSARWAGA